MTLAPMPTAPPTPADVAAASTRLHESRARLAAVPIRRPTLPPPREFRPVDAQAVVSEAVERDRRHFVDCSRGAHNWTSTPFGRVCLHCPIPESQADRVRARRRADLDPA